MCLVIRPHVFQCYGRQKQKDENSKNGFSLIFLDSKTQKHFPVSKLSYWAPVLPLFVDFLPVWAKTTKPMCFWWKTRINFALVERTNNFRSKYHSHIIKIMKIFDFFVLFVFLAKCFASYIQMYEWKILHFVGFSCDEWKFNYSIYLFG